MKKTQKKKNTYKKKKKKTWLDLPVKAEATNKPPSPPEQPDALAPAHSFQRSAKQCSRIVIRPKKYVRLRSHADDCVGKIPPVSKLAEDMGTRKFANPQACIDHRVSAPIPRVAREVHGPSRMEELGMRQSPRLLISRMMESARTLWPVEERPPDLVISWPVRR